MANERFSILHNMIRFSRAVQRNEKSWGALFSFCLSFRINKKQKIRIIIELFHIFVVINQNKTNNKQLIITIMLYRVTVKNSKLTNGVRIDKGMSVDVVTNSTSNPVLINGGKEVADAFMRIYGIDIKKAGALSMAWLEVERIR